MKFKTLLGLFIGSLTTFFLLSLLANKLTDKQYWFFAAFYLIFMVLTYIAINFIRKVKSSKKTDSF
jgi:threonine/homoserine/homoserine lactone efflux protein